MLCDVCSKNLATVHLTEIMGGKIIEVHLCEDCAKKKTEDFQKQFNIADFLSELVDINSIDKMAVPDVICSGCGLSYQDFKKSGRLGCALCYEDFKEQLNPLLKKIHGYAKHKGKTPRIKTKKEVSPNERIKELRFYLGRAVKLEEYEEAASIRDEIRELEKKLKKQPPKQPEK